MRGSILKLFMLAIGTLAFMASWLITDHYPPWTSFYSEFATGVALIAAILYITFDGSWASRVPFPKAALFIALIAFVPVAQFFLGQILFYGDAVMSLAYILGSAFAVTVGYVFSVNKGAKFLVYFSVLILLVSLLTAGIIVYQWIGLDYLSGWVSIPKGSRPYGNLNQPNQAAALLVLGYLASLYLFFTEKIGALVHLAIIPLIAIGLVLTGSRSGLLSFFVASMVNFTFINSPNINRKRLHLFFGLSLVFFLVICLHLFSSTLPLGIEARSLNTSSSGRVEIWGQLLSALAHSPIWGYGWGQVSVAQFLHSVSLSSHPMAEQVPLVFYSHNFVLDVLIWNGVVLGGIILLCCLAWFRRHAFNVSEPGGLMSVSVIVVILIHGLLEFHHTYTYMLFVLMMFAGVLSAHKDRTKFSFSKPIIFLSALFGVIFLAVLWRDYRIVESDHRLSRFGTARIGLTTSDEYSSSKIVVLDNLAALISFSRSCVRADIDAGVLDQYRRVVMRYPYSAFVAKLALLEYFNGNFYEAYNVYSVLDIVRSQGGANLRRGRYRLSEYESGEHGRFTCP